MKREWKTGDVAINGDEFVTLSDEGVWYWATTALPCLDQPPANLRPVVVIDPEDREQVEQFVAAYFKTFWASPGAGAIVSAGDKPRDAVEPIHLDAMQDALRSLITQPKPDEPTGLGAVVEDAVGHHWVRIAAASEDPVGPHLEQASPPWRRRGATARWWDKVNAVKVLSEGVQPC